MTTWLDAGLQPPLANGDVRKYGAVGDGVTDDTSAVSKAIAANTQVILPYGYIFLVSALTPTTSVKLVGGGTLKQKANPGVPLLYYSAAVSDLSLELDGVIIDGNQANQGAKPSNISIDFRSTGTASPTLLRVVNCTFKNAGVADIRCFGNQTGGLITCIITDNHFIGGAQGDAGGTYFPRALDLADAIDVTVSNNHFDLNAAIASGKAGIVGYYNQAEAQPTQFSQFVRVIITNNSFYRYGRDTSNGQGPIDLYGYSIDAIISNNVMRNSALRAINVKASDPRVIIANNQIDTVGSGLTQTGTGIVCNAGTTTDFYNDIVIEGNIVSGCTYDGIFVNGFNSTLTAGLRAGVSIKNNIVRGCGSGGTGRDIALQACTNADISGNLCFSNGAAASFQFQQCSGVITIRNNQIVTPTNRCILLNAGDTNSAAFFEVSENTFVASTSFSGAGCVAYMSTIGGLNWLPSNRIFGSLGATPIFTDFTSQFTASTATNILTVSAITTGVILPGHILLAQAAGGSVPVNSIIQPYGTGATTGTGGTGTYQLSTTPGTVASQTFNTVGVSYGTQSDAKTETLNNNLIGTITIHQNTVKVDTASAAASGSLYWINGGYPGMVTTFKFVNAARVVTFKDNANNAATGNIHIGGDFIPSALTNSLTLVFNGATGFWEKVASN